MLSESHENDPRNFCVLPTRPKVDVNGMKIGHHNQRVSHVSFGSQMPTAALRREKICTAREWVRMTRYGTRTRRKKDQHSNCCVFHSFIVQQLWNGMENTTVGMENTTDQVFHNITYQVFHSSWCFPPCQRYAMTSRPSK